MAKDILWFHAVIWEAVLIAAGIDLPKTVFAHGFFTVNGQKMAKSLGNVITPKQMVDKYGVDGARYLLISAVSFGSDGDISLESFDTKYNADLANGLGNLVARVSKLAEGLSFKPNPTTNKVITEVQLNNKIIPTQYGKLIESHRFDEVLKLLWGDIKIIENYLEEYIGAPINISAVDQYINKSEPWKLSGEKKQNVLQIAIDSIRYLGVQLEPFMPLTSEKIESQFKGPKIKSESPLFPRI